MNTKLPTLTRRVHFVAKPADVRKWQLAAAAEEPKAVDLSEWIRDRCNDAAGENIDWDLGEES